MAEEALVQTDQLFRALVEHSPQALLLLRPDSTILYANAAAAHLAGSSAEKLLGMNNLALLHPGDRARVVERIASFLATGRDSLTLEYCVRDGCGGWNRVEATLQNLLENPQVGALICSKRAISPPRPAPFKKSDRDRPARDGGASQASTEETWQEKSFRDAERQFRSLVESNVVGMMITDQEGRIYETNAYLARKLGYSREELLSETMRVKDLLVPTYHSARTRAWKTLTSQGSSLPEEKEYRRKDGRIFPALVTAATINPERTRALVVVLDMSARRNAERRKEEYFSMVSHELRNPLAVIQGFLELALFCVERISEVASTEAHDFLNKLETMLQQAQHQTRLEARLVADLVDTSRIEMQKFAVNLQACNLVEIVQKAVDNQRQAALGRQIELILPTEPIVAVEVDPDRIDQVLSNYLTNAFKYSPAAQPVRVELIAGTCMVRVSVSDCGSGLTEEQQQHVWDRFYQIESSAQQGAERGLGLGLYIVRSIIAQHQGQVGVRSHTGQGSTFWFALPLADEIVC